MKPNSRKTNESSPKAKEPRGDERLDERMDEVVHAMKHTFTGAGTEQGRVGK